MSVIELFWYLNVNDTSKYLIILAIIICLVASCTLAGRKKKIKKKKPNS